MFNWDVNVGLKEWTNRKQLETDGAYLFSQLAFVEIDLGGGLLK